MNVTASGPDTAKNFNFEFSGLKEKGDPGEPGPKGDPGEPGPKGDPGTAAGFGTVTATVTNTTGTPSVTVTTSGPDTAKNFDFAFSGLKGESGDPASVPAYTVEKLTLAAYANSAAEYAIKKDGVALTPNIIIPRHGLYINDVAPVFTHVDIPSGSRFLSTSTFSVDWSLDMYTTKGVVCDFRLYPKTNSQYTINMSGVSSSFSIGLTSAKTVEISGRKISMDTYQSVGKIFVLQSYAQSFKVNTTSTDRLYLCCKLCGGGSLMNKYFELTFFPLDSDPTKWMYLGSSANCNLIQLS